MAEDEINRRLTITRGAHRGQMTKLLKKLEDLKVTFTDPPSQDQQQAYRGIYDSVITKFDHLKKIDETIVEATATDALAAVIVETDDYVNELKAQIDSACISVFNPSTGNDNSTVHVKRTVNLPKLQLPKFDGNFLHWSGFIDAFTSAVDSDDKLDNIQKFQYLRAELIGDASKTIEGLQLTSANYTEAMELLRERYGQPHKLISCYMKALWELRKPSNSLDSLREFYDNLESYIRGLKSLGKSEDSYGDLLVPIVFEKLPGQVRTNISRDHGDCSWSLTQLKTSLYREIQASIAGASLDTASNLPTATTAAFHTLHKTSPHSPQRKLHVCAFCKGQHYHNDCVVISDHEKRREIIMRERLCFNCLRGNHRASECNSRGRCQNCQRRHHTAICVMGKSKTLRTTEPKGLVARSSSDSTTHIALVPASGPVLLKTAVSTLKSVTGRAAQVNILFDEGAQRTFITEVTAVKLGINFDTCDSEHVQLSTFGTDAHGIQAVKVTPVSLLTRCGHVNMNVLIVPKISAPMKNYVRSTIANYAYLQKLCLAEPVNSDHFEIDMLLGADYYWSVVGNEIIKGAGPTAVSSKLGYLLSGPSNLKIGVGVFQTTCLLEITTELLDTRRDIANLTKFWDLETIGITEDDTLSNRKTFQNFRDENISMLDGKYSVKLPWLPNHPPLPDNYNACYSRTRSMVRKLSPELLKTYNSIIANQLSRDFIERVPDDEVMHGHYIPHHCVTKDSATTPIRIVYDCSCKQPNSPSLNQCLETGPALINDLVGILLRFRVNEIAFTADIEKAFLNVQLDKEDRNYTKFLWLSDPTDPGSEFDIYRFKVVLFGATCSPFILNAVVKSHLESHPSDVSDDLSKNTYIDNVISGISAESLSDELASDRAIKYYNVANDVMRQGGFNLRMWATNDSKLREIAHNDDNDDPNDNVGVVGLRWSTTTDMMSYASKASIHSEASPTKREIVRAAASIYDPLGFLTPVHIKAKLLIQKIWQQGHVWDELLADDLANEWFCIREELNSAKCIMFQRQYFFDNSDRDCELHMFADASPKAYGSAAYLKCGKESVLVMAKNRIKPLKDMSLPRLELMAALIAARLADFVSKELTNVNIVKRILWSDSQIVLHWLQSEKRLPVFVQNRVNEIRATHFDDVRYCPSKDNPADLLTRGISSKELANSNLWFRGPPWLPLGAYPACEVFNNNVLACDAEQSDDHVLSVNAAEPTHNAVLETTTNAATSGESSIHGVIDITRFSTLGKLLRVTAYVHRFIAKLRKRVCVTSDEYVTTLELRNAKQFWIKNVQSEAYSREFTALKRNVRCTLVNQLKLFLDSDGIIRCGGRLHNSDLDYCQKYPVLLPTRHPYTSLEVASAHKLSLHSGVEATITFIRQTYWIPKIRPTVKSLLRKCRQCIAVSGKPYQKPIAPPLPACRIQQTPPFSVTGVDFTGVLYYKDAHTRFNKAYICLFTCAITRAIHLELVTDMTSGAFLRAFRRFSSRRSLPAQLISDNAATFIAAAENIRQLVTDEIVLTYLANKQVKWNFIPKRAPWFGGFYERLIGLTKTSLRKVLGRASVTLDELITVLAEIEAVINDRPLTRGRSDADALTPLTPSHLVNGRMLSTLPHRTFEDDEISDPSFSLQNVTDVHARSAYLDKLFEHLWNRWRNEYLACLREQQASNSRYGCTDNVISVGDIVLIHSDTDKRVNWKLARVEGLNYGHDGLVRSANIKTQNGVTNRPIAKLYPLEVHANDSSDHTHGSNNDVNALPGTQTATKRPVRAAAERARLLWQSAMFD